MKTKRESRKMREESRKHSQFGISDLRSACSESENDLRLEISSCDSGTDGPPCLQWRKDRKRKDWYFHPCICSLKKPNTQPLCPKTTIKSAISLLFLQKERSDLVKTDPLKERISHFETCRAIFFPKSTHADLILHPGKGLITIPPDWSGDRLAST